MPERALLSFMKRILVTGAEGLLGSEVVRCARARGYEVVGAARTDLDVTDANAVRRALGDGHADAGEAARRTFTAVVHCAAYTAVDGAEAEVEQAWRVNRDGTRHVARAAAEAGVRLVYVSSDYVFDGSNRVPYTPEADARPLGVYGRTKLLGEVEAMEALPKALVVRTSWLYGAGGRNFVTSMLALGRRRVAAGGTDALRVVDDQVGRPSWARNVAVDLLDLLERNVSGVWHVADADEASWLDLAREVFQLTGVKVAVQPVSTQDWGAPARRPAYSVLDVTATEALLGRPAMPWRRALQAFLAETGELDAG
jgi:dTDP-4-dehydrorhamnose reductase